MPSSPPTLRDMVQAEHDRGQTYKQITARAIDPVTGAPASHGLIYDLANDNVNRVPTVPHLRAVAAALRVPYETVRRAAIAQWLPAEDATDPEAIREEVIGEARRLRDLADETLDRLGDNGGQRGSA